MHKINIIGTNEDGLQKIEAELEEIGMIEVDDIIIYKHGKIVSPSDNPQ